MSSYDKIPKILIDKNTVLEKQILNNKKTVITKLFPDGHTQFSHLFCILLRIFIGILVLSDSVDSSYIIILCLLVVIVFGSKFLSNLNNTNSMWKNYLKVLLNYILVLYLQLSNNSNKNQISGILIIMDSLMSQQSRFITTNMSRNSPL